MNDGLEDRPLAAERGMAWHGLEWHGMACHGEKIPIYGCMYVLGMYSVFGSECGHPCREGCVRDTDSMYVLGTVESIHARPDLENEKRM
jgi:hypothetical protein